MSESFDEADHATAVDLATRAGQILLGVRASGAVGSELKSLGDRTSHDFLVAELARRRPHDAVLSEEGADDPRRLEYDRVWVVDPVDGTREFAEPPRDDWAVHVALCVGGAPVVGAVALPARGEVYGTADPYPALRAPAATPRILASRTRSGGLGELLRDEFGGELIPMGSAGAKAMAVVRGDADLYAHAGGQFEWDSAAPVAVARAAGLHVSRLSGAPLKYNRPSPWLPDLLICHPDLARPVLDLIDRYGHRR